MARWGLCCGAGGASCWQPSCLLIFLPIQSWGCRHSRQAQNLGAMLHCRRCSGEQRRSWQHSWPAPPVREQEAMLSGRGYQQEHAWLQSRHC